jgi:hypothetical protein
MAKKHLSMAEHHYLSLDVNSDDVRPITQKPYIKSNLVNSKQSTSQAIFSLIPFLNENMLNFVMTMLCARLQIHPSELTDFH